MQIIGGHIAFKSLCHTEKRIFKIKIAAVLSSMQGSTRLRVKDIDFGQNQLIVRNGKGMKDRSAMLPDQLKPLLQGQLKEVRTLHVQDIQKGVGEVYLPFALEKKYRNAGNELIWKYVFPSDRIAEDPRSNKMRRRHVDESGLRKAVKPAAQKAGVRKKVNPHTFRHSFATHLPESGYDIRTVQELSGHNDVSTTMIYLHVMNKGGLGVKSPPDSLL